MRLHWAYTAYTTSSESLMPTGRLAEAFGSLPACLPQIIGHPEKYL